VFIYRSVGEHVIWVRISTLLHLIAHAGFPITLAVTVDPFCVEFPALVEVFHRTNGIPLACPVPISHSTYHHAGIVAAIPMEPYGWKDIPLTPTAISTGIENRLNPIPIPRRSIPPVGMIDKPQCTSISQIVASPPILSRIASSDSEMLAVKVAPGMA